MVHDVVQDVPARVGMFQHLSLGEAVLHYQMHPNIVHRISDDHNV